MTATRQAHPAAKIFPMMQENELQRLADDIKDNGQREKIVLTKEGLILDGRNRAAACKLAGKVPKTGKWGGKPGTELEFVLSRNIHRRHLDESQRAMAAALAACAPALPGKAPAEWKRPISGMLPDSPWRRQ
jgi:hypothetical protein